MTHQELAIDRGTGSCTETAWNITLWYFALEGLILYINHTNPSIPIPRQTFCGNDDLQAHTSQRDVLWACRLSISSKEIGWRGNVSHSFECLLSHVCHGRFLPPNECLTSVLPPTWVPNWSHSKNITPKWVIAWFLPGAGKENQSHREPFGSLHGNHHAALAVH